jgi:hypothetical protein
MTFYKAEDIAKNGGNLTVGDTVVISDTKSFTITGVNVFVSPLDGKGNVTFTFAYSDGERTGVNSVHSDHIGNWLK